MPASIIVFEFPYVFYPWTGELVAVWRIPFRMHTQSMHAKSRGMTSVFDGSLAIDIRLSLPLIIRVLLLWVPNFKCALALRIKICCAHRRILYYIRGTLLFVGFNYLSWRKVHSITQWSLDYSFSYNLLFPSLWGYMAYLLYLIIRAFTSFFIQLLTYHV